MNTSATTAIILKRINFGEADRILTVITPDNGKLSVLAKGARKSKSRLAGGLELFSVSNISFVNGKSDIKTLVSAQLVQHYGKIVENIQTTMMAYDFLKMTDKFTQQSCDENYFNLLKEAIQALDEHHEHPDIVFAWFVSQLLGLTGSAINVEKQITGKEFDESENYEFDYDDMGFYVKSSSGGQYSPKHIKFLRLLAKVSKPSNLIHISDAKRLAIELRPMLENCLTISNN